MAGILGYGDPTNTPGILGGAMQQGEPDWADKLGLFSAALKDAAAQFSGRDDPGTLQAWRANQQQQQIRQQLLGALSSQDPSVRQQGYTAAALMGIDTKPFQQQQVSQQLPALLQSMRPTTQNLAVPGASADLTLPGRNGLAPTQSTLNIPQGPSLGTFQQPGLSIGDALAQAGPEVQAEYAPKLLDQQMAADAEANKPFDLSPGQHRFQNGQDIASLPEKNNPNQPFNADGSPNLAYQKYARDQETYKASLNQDTSPPDPGTVQYWAQSVAAGAPLPALGMGKQAALYRQAILKGAAQINSGQGLTGIDQNVNAANTKANSGALTKQTALRSATEGFENTMLQNMNVARDLLKKGAGTTGIPVLNRYQQYIKGQYAGDPDVVALKNAIDTVADENAKIRSGTLGNTPATDAMRASIHDGLNTSQTPEQILSAFGVMEKDAGNRSRALRAQEAALRRGIGGKNDLPQIPGIREPQASNIPSMTGNAAAPLTSTGLPRLPISQPKIRVFNPATGRLE